MPSESDSAVKDWYARNAGVHRLCGQHGTPGHAVNAWQFVTACMKATLLPGLKQQQQQQQTQCLLVQWTYHLLHFQTW
jgi:hypothetical protein